MVIFQNQKVCNLPTDPVIISLTSSPSSSVMVGDSITLTCSVVLPDGVTGTPDYQWTGPAGLIDTATHSSNDQSASSVLTLSEIEPSQAGEYTCTATLSNGPSNATSINVTVQSKFLILLAYIVLFSCIVANSKPSNCSAVHYVTGPTRQGMFSCFD